MDEPVERFEPVSLEELDERAALLRRVDNKYADGRAAGLRDGVILVETKSERGESPADRVLAELGLEPISVNKYPVGVSLVGGGNRAPQPGAELFEPAG